MGLREVINSRYTVERWMGDEALVSCPHPDHHDSTPSACINVRKRLWVCYSCGKGGTLDNLLGGRIADPDLDEVLDDLAKTLTTLGAEQPTYPESWLDQFDGAGVHPYWTGRGFSEDTCRLFRLGYDPTTGRATYPLRAASGAVWGVVGRATKDSQVPKYLYPPHAPVSQTLFGYHLVKNGMVDVVLTEGAIDAMAMWEVGIPAVAQLGASLSQEQLRLLKRLNLRTITFAYDQDPPGRKAFRNVIDRIDWCGVRHMEWDEQWGKDPMDLDPDLRVRQYHEAEWLW